MRQSHERVRLTSDYHIHDWQHHYLYNGTDYISEFDYPTLTFRREIVDVAGKSKRKDGLFPPSPVRSETVSVGGTPQNNSGISPGGDAWFHTNKPPCVPLDVVSGMLPSLSSSVLGIESENALRGFLTQVPVEVSVLNFFWEARELKSLLPKLESTLLKTGASGFLNLNFGWKPFVGDLEKLASLNQIVISKINHLKETFGKRTRLHHYVPDVVGIPLWRDSVKVGWRGIQSIWLAEHRTDLRFNGYLYHELEGLDSVAGEFRAFAAALGLNNPLKVFWEAIPYSFVFDWFLRISTRLDWLTAQPFHGRYEISDMTTSIKSISRFILQEQLGYPDEGNFPQVPYGELQVERYERMLGIPVDLASFNLASLTPQQLALYGALIFK